MKSKLLYSNNIQKIETILKDFLNSQNKIDLGLSSGTGVRTSGDKTQKIISQQSQNLLSGFGKNFLIQESRKSMYNFAFTDKVQPVQYFVNTITHRIETKFNMPNITSVDRLQNLYQNDNVYFIILLISYESAKSKNFIYSVDFKPIEFFSWDSLGIGALGSGQLQIKDVKNPAFSSNKDRKEWMLEFGERLKDFYIDEARKIVSRLEKARQLKNTWINKI